MSTSSFNDHVKNNSIELIERTCGLMLNDTNSFIFLRSEGLNLFKKYSLGGGNLLMVIGQFAVLNFLSKVYAVASRGEKAYKTEEDVRKYLEIIENLKQNNSEVLSKLKKYCKKPNLGEVNETMSFIELVKDYPENIGIPREETIIKKVWEDFRNKISHIATIANGNSAFVFEFQKNDSFNQAKRFIEKTNEKPFYILTKDEKNKMRKEIIADNNKKGIATSTSAIAGATYNQIRPDILSRDIRKIMRWLINRIKNNEFKEDNIGFLYDWLLTQHYVNN